MVIGLCATTPGRLRVMSRALFAILLLLAAPALAGERLTVVELFTSQGCPNCPPAQAVFEEIAAAEDVLALTWAVDYWDFMGWRDTFAAPGHMERQRAYNDRFGEPGVYTPELVIDGRREMVGSRRAEVMAALTQLRRSLRTDFAVELSEEGIFCIASLPAATPPRPLTLRAVWYKSVDTVDVTRGENAGRRLVFHNVVKAARVIGVWTGEEVHFRFPVEPPGTTDADHLAILLEDGEAGPIYGAAVMALES